MNTIKFSHDYPKLHGQTSAELLAVRPLKIDAHTPRELLEYDTTYYKYGFCTWGDPPKEKLHFPLPSGEYLQLIFLGNLRIPFCTIRKAWPSFKIDYYKSKIGETFVVEIMESEE